MKTALQEFMEWIETNDNSYNALFAYQKAEELMEKEREQIMKAFVDGKRVIAANAVAKFIPKKNDDPEVYYNQTNNEKNDKLE
jgi:hypothetical protein